MKHPSRKHGNSMLETEQESAVRSAMYTSENYMQEPTDKMNPIVSLMILNESYGPRFRHGNSCAGRLYDRK